MKKIKICFILLIFISLFNLSCGQNTINVKFIRMERCSSYKTHHIGYKLIYKVIKINGTGKMLGLKENDILIDIINILPADKERINFYKNKIGIIINDCTCYEVTNGKVLGDLYD